MSEGLFLNDRMACYKFERSSQLFPSIKCKLQTRFYGIEMLEVHRQNRSRLVEADLRFNPVATEPHGTVVGVVDLLLEVIGRWETKDLYLSGSQNGENSEPRSEGEKIFRI